MAQWISALAALFGLIRLLLRQMQTRIRNKEIVDQLTLRTKAKGHDLLLKVLGARQQARAGYLARNDDNAGTSDSRLPNHRKKQS